MRLEKFGFLSVTLEFTGFMEVMRKGDTIFVITNAIGVLYQGNRILSYKSVLK